MKKYKIKVEETVLRQHAGNMSGSTCAEDLAEYKKKLPSPPKETR